MAKFLGKSLKKLTADKDPTRKTAKGRSISASGSGYFYLTGIVREFIGEPDVYLNLNKGKVPKVLNFDDYELMTKNCLIAYIIDMSESQKGKLPVICYPFFPHMSLPIKVGEHVWILKEEDRERDVYYWLSRKSGIKQTEDPNYTHAERFSLIDEKLNENNPKIKNNLGKGNLFNTAITLPDAAYTSFDISSQDNLPEGLNTSLLSDSSFSFRSEFTAEPVPPVRKKCGDTLLLGSNNSLIHLTTEKFKTSTLNKKDFTGQLSEPDLPGRYPLSPAIDLCIGRKKLELEELKNTTTDKAEIDEVRIVKAERGSLYSKLESYEIDKLGNLLDKNREFFSGLSTDFEATNCGARLYLSNNCAVDETFGSSFNVLGTLGGSSIVTYADHNRIIADNSLRLTNRVGQSFIDMDSEGNVVIKSSTDNGQQFLSLSANGITRIQAKKGGKILLGVRNNDTPDNPAEGQMEPYVLVSQLEAFITDLVVNVLTPALGAITTAGTSTAGTVLTVGTTLGGIVPNALTATTALTTNYTGPLSKLRSTKIYGEKE